MDGWIDGWFGLLTSMSTVLPRLHPALLSNVAQCAADTSPLVSAGMASANITEQSPVLKIRFSPPP